MAAVSVSAPGSRRSLITAWLVLHDRANAVSRGTGPSSKSSSLGIVRPDTVIESGHGTISSGPTTPASSAAAVVTTLNVDPGGNRPCIDTGPCRSAEEFCATASTPPVDGWIATIDAASPLPSTASCAARCIEICTVETRSSTSPAGAPPSSIGSAPGLTISAVQPASASSASVQASGNPVRTGESSSRSVRMSWPCSGRLTPGTARSCSRIGSISLGRSATTWYCWSPASAMPSRIVWPVIVGAAPLTRDATASAEATASGARVTAVTGVHCSSGAPVRSRTEVS